MKDNDNADRAPRVVLGRAVPAGATVAYRVGDDGWDGWEIDVLEDPAAVLASDELVAVLDEPEPRLWPSAPLIRVWEGSDGGAPVPPGMLMVRDNATGQYRGLAGCVSFSVWPGVAGDSLTKWDVVELVPTSVLGDMAVALARWDSAVGSEDEPEAQDALVQAVRALVAPTSEVEEVVS